MNGFWSKTVFLFLFGVLATGETRVWTSAAGTSLEAELIAMQGQELTLRLLSGKELTLAADQLSKEDQAYLAELRATLTPQERAGSQAAKRQTRAPFENWDAPWPTLIRLRQLDFEVAVISEDPSRRQFIYHSDHFEFICDVPLAKSLVKKFAWYFEATHAFVASLPLSMARTQEEKKHQIVLYEEMKTYHQNGGPLDSSGVYLGGEDIIMVPLPSVGVRKAGSQYRIDYDTSNRTLSHEIVHQLTDRPYYQKGALGWFTEGLAEYVALTPYRSGIYQPGRSVKEIKDFVTSFGSFDRGYDLGHEITVGPLEDFMKQSYQSFTSNSHHNYGVGCLITTYFLELGGEEERRNLQNYLKALKALPRGEDPYDAHQTLLSGRSYKTLAEMIARKWKSKGVDLHFY